MWTTNGAIMGKIRTEGTRRPETMHQDDDVFAKSVSARIEVKGGADPDALYS